MILFPIAYLLWFIWWRDGKLSELKKYIEKQSDSWKKLNLDQDLFVELKKDIQVNFWMFGICFHQYIFEQKFILNGSHMDQYEIENGISGVYVPYPASSGNILMGDEDDSVFSSGSDMLKQYKFKMNSFKSQKKSKGSIKKGSSNFSSTDGGDNTSIVFDDKLENKMKQVMDKTNEEKSDLKEDVAKDNKKRKFESAL